MRRRACGTGCGCRAYTGGDLDLSTAEGAYYGGMETLRARRESAVKSARVREAQDREARKGRRTGGGQRWFGYTRIYANPDEPNHKKRHILREEINPVEAEAIRDAATRVLEHGESVASIARDWTARGIRPVAATQWWPTSIVGTLTSPRLAGLREWQGRKYPATGWPAIIDADTHERLVRLFARPGAAQARGARPGAPAVGHRDLPQVRPGAALPAARERPRGFLRVREGPGRVRRDGDQGGPAGGVRDRRGAGRAGIPARAASAARRARTSTRRAARTCWRRSGTPGNGGRRPAGTIPAG